MDLNELFLSYPEFVWQGVFSLASTLIAGLIIAFVTTFYLKKKDERTRVAGVVLEKRINSEQVILDFLENASFTLEMPKDVSRDLHDLIVTHELELPHGRNIQYAKVFSSNTEFQSFFRQFEQHVSRHRLWLSKEVRFHLELMQGYFAWINANLVMIRRIPLPEGIRLTDEEYGVLSDKIILIQGITLDSEFKGLIAHLEVLMVDSIYRLKLNRIKRSSMRNGLVNRDTKKRLNILFNKTVLGAQRIQIVALIATAVYALKGIALGEVDPRSFAEEFSGTEAVRGKSSEF